MNSIRFFKNQVGIQIMWSQVGINTAHLTTILDVNGDWLMRNATVSSSTDEIPLVIDGGSNVKKKFSDL